MIFALPCCWPSWQLACATNLFTAPRFIAKNTATIGSAFIAPTEFAALGAPELHFISLTGIRSGPTFSI
jgi:hypothetical protein